jgi:2'-5' RNA ligase
MSLLRAFVASELPAVLQDKIQIATAGFRRALHEDLIRWVPVHNVHLTLKFLGDVSPAGLSLVQQMLTAEATQFTAFDITVEALGCYPNAKRPRVLWVGLKAPPELTSLQRAIEAGTARLGYESEERGFSPHLTIGRVRQNVSPADIQTIRTALEQNQIGPLGTTRLNAVHLFKSELRPEGSIYTRLYSAPLRES